MVGEAILMSSAADTARPDAAERLGRLFDAHHDRLYRLARRMAGSAEAARDAVQDTFLRAARSPQSIPEGVPHEEAWLVRVLVNVCRDEWRKREVRRRTLPPVEIASGAAESALIARAVVQQALQALPPRRRAILVMYELEGAGIPAIAQLLGIRAVTVRWHLSVGRNEMARLIGHRR